MSNKKKLRLLCIGMSLLLVLFILAGCGGSSSDSSAPELDTTTVDGTVSAPSGTDTTEEVASVDFLQRITNLFNKKVIAGSIRGSTPVGDAKVIAVNFNTNQQVGTVATTESDGSYTISGIPEGINVMIVVEKKVGDKRVHLSTLVPDVGNIQQLGGREPGVVDAATTITALRYSKQRGNSDFKIALIDVENTLKEAKTTVDNIISNNGGMDLTVGSGCIKAGSDGKPELDTENNTELASFETKTAVPDPEDYPAKVMIQDVRNAGIFLNKTLNEQITKQQQTSTEIANFFGTVGTEFAEIDHLITSNFFDNPPGEYNLNLDGIFSQVEAYAYRNADYWKWQINDASTEHSAHIRMTNLNDIKESPEDPVAAGYDYSVDLREAIFEYDVNETTDTYYFQGSVTLGNNNSDVIETEIVDFYGDTVKLIIPYNPEYSLDGIFHGPESSDVAMNLTLTGNSNSSLTDTSSLGFVGSLNTQKIDANGEFNVSATGDQDISANTPDTAELIFVGDVTTATAEYHGDFDIDFIKNINMVDIVPESVAFNGSYNDLAPQTTTWNGSLTVTIDNAKNYDDLNASYFAYGNVNFNGEVTHVNHPTISLNLNAGVNKTLEGMAGEGDGYLKIAYAHGGNTLDGTMEVLDTDLGQNMTLRLTNQNNIQLSLNEEYNDNTYISTITGSIKDADGNIIATIDDNEQGVPTVHYDDETMETLF